MGKFAQKNFSLCGAAALAPSLRGLAFVRNEQMTGGVLLPPSKIKDFCHLPQRGRQGALRALSPQRGDNSYCQQCNKFQFTVQKFPGRFREGSATAYTQEVP